LPPDFEPEDEVDLGRYWRALVLRWWLPLGGLAIGIVIGYLVALGGSNVYSASSTIYLGQTLSPSGIQLQSQATNPSTVGAIIHSEDGLRQAARAAGMPVRRLRGQVSSQAVAGSLARLGQTPLVKITVTGSGPRQVQRAANALARIVLQRTSGYVATKIKTYRSQLAAEAVALKSIDQLIAQLRASASSPSLSATDRLILASQLNGQLTQRFQVVQQQTQSQQLLAVAQDVEQGSLITRAVPVKTTARSRRNSVVVGGAIGLILGILAALLWEPAARIFRRPV
jgi:uncharacterized protein involved in exopolysaccharide biosynthesis